MTRRWMLIVIAVSLIGCLALVFIYPHQMVAPGPLIPAHASLETDCFACHAPLRGASAERCIGCHTVADIGLRTTKGAPIARAKAATPFHQGLTAQTCMSCHTDHTIPALTTLSRTGFEHGLLNPAIGDNCASCHVAPATLVHNGVTASCGQCHGQASWKQASFDHTKFFALDRDHNVPCATCHTTNDRRQYTCYGCHEHTETKIRSKHVREGIANFTDCASCHRSAHGDRREGSKGREGSRRELKED